MDKYIDDYIKGIGNNDNIQKIINDYKNHPIISSRPSEKNWLMTKILQPLMDKKTKLEQNKAEKEEANKQAQSFVASLRSSFGTKS
jgi:hypothetical protein